MRDAHKRHSSVVYLDNRFSRKMVKKGILKNVLKDAHLLK